MATSNFNMEDPAKQETIRRGHHEYIPTAGKHGAYVAKPYAHQEYPKMMGKFRKPARKDFPGIGGAEGFESAMREWDHAMTNTVVNNKAEEVQWLKANG